MNLSKNNLKQPEGGLLQSQVWADFLRAKKSGVVEIEFNKNKFFGVVQKLPLVGKYLYIPRLTFQNKENTSEAIQKIFKAIEEKKFGWVRMDLLSKKDLRSVKKYSKQKVVKAPRDMQPKDHLIIDISVGEEELLKQMKSKARYNIRLAERKGVKIFTSRKKEDLKKFFDLVNKTAQRKNVSFHSFSHYQKMFETLSEDYIKLYLAEYEGKIIAANIVTFYDGVATYLHGGLDGEYRKLMAPFLLQWKIIQDARQNDCQWYDLGGVFLNSKDDGKAGITRFKQGFSPKTEIFETMGSYDVVLCPVKYWAYCGLQKAKGLISGL